MFIIQSGTVVLLLIAVKTESFAPLRIRDAGLAFCQKHTSTHQSPHAKQQQPSQHRQRNSRSSTRLRPLQGGLFSSSTAPPADSLYSARFSPAIGDQGYSHSGNSAVDNRHSSNDFWYNIRTLPNSSILKDIKNPVLAVFGWSTAVSILHFVLQKSSSSFLQVLASKLSVSSAAHSFLVSSLGLLLVFRTNSSYQRFYVSDFLNCME